jgi:threonine/homoserine efflux transporter RhtA
MAGFNAQKHWWIVIVAVAVLGVAALQITEQWMPDYSVIGDLLFFALIGAGFCWVYSVNRERLWWAIIPGILSLAMLVALLSDAMIGTDPENDWISVLILGIGAVIVGSVLKRVNVKLVLMIVAMFTFIVGFAMAPFPRALKGVLIAADVLIFNYAWRNRSTLVKSR